jgi:hypothetical protein
LANDTTTEWSYEDVEAKAKRQSPEVFERRLRKWSLIRGEDDLVLIYLSGLAVTLLQLEPCIEPAMMLYILLLLI